MSKLIDKNGNEIVVSGVYTDGSRRFTVIAVYVAYLIADTERAEKEVFEFDAVKEWLPYKQLLKVAVGADVLPPDNVNHPKHYKQHPSGIECIEITRWMNFNLGNAFKYIWRTDHKNGVEDLRKAIWYINDEIERLENAKIDR